MTRPRYFDRPVDTGLVRPEAPDEALIDVEAWLREPIPEEELIRLRAGLKRPARGTVLREPITLPDEELLRRHEELLRPTIDGMQGRWRVERMYLDGAELRLDQFAGVKYLVQNRVIFQSEMSEEGGIPENVAAAPTPMNGNGTNGTPREPGMEPKPEATPAPTPVYTRPASPSLPAPRCSATIRVRRRGCDWRCYSRARVGRLSTRGIGMESRSIRTFRRIVHRSALPCRSAAGSDSVMIASPLGSGALVCAFPSQ